MINRELYMSRIRPFINQDIIKVLTGIRRSGKSVMLELIQDELRSIGIPDKQFLTVNFEYICKIVSCNELIDYSRHSTYNDVLFEKLQHSFMHCSWHLFFCNKILLDTSNRLSIARNLSAVLALGQF